MEVKQIRCYGKGDSRNTKDQSISGEFDEILVKGYPGLKVEINGKSIKIGETGIYNILAEENVKITSFKIPGMDESEDNTPEDKENANNLTDIPSAYIVATLAKYDEETPKNNSTEETTEPGQNQGTDTGTTDEPQGDTPTAETEEEVLDNHDSRK